MHAAGLYALDPGPSTSECDPHPLTKKGSLPNPTDDPAPRLQPVDPFSSPLFGTA